MSDDNQACEVPLVEQLRSVPKDYRTSRAIQWSDDGRETGHQYIPVGFMMHRAADEIERLSARPEAEPINAAKIIGWARMVRNASPGGKWTETEIKLADAIMGVASGD